MDKEHQAFSRANAKSSTIEPPMIQAAARGLTTITSADTAWMGPGKTLQAIVPLAAGRQYDYQAGANLSITPRASEYIGFPELRGLADSYYLVRLAIQTRKDQMYKMKGSFVPSDPKAKPDARCDDINKFFKTPNKRDSFSMWIKLLLEDLLVIDAPTIYCHKNQGGKPYAFEVIDGATIKVLLDQYGRTPLPPEAAFQQNLHGVPAVNYTSDELIYRPSNPRSWKAYGFSPVEQIVQIVNIGLRRTISQQQFYTEGNIPEALIGTPTTWNPDQIAQYQVYWDSIMEGNTAARRHAKFVPGGMDVHETKSAQLTDAFDEWLARVVQYCFSLPATPYLKQVNKGETTNMKEQAEEEGLEPILAYFKEYLDALKDKFWGFDDIEWKWNDEKSIDPLVQANIDNIYLTADVLDKNEVRANLGLEARDYEKEAADKMKAAQTNMPNVNIGPDGKPLPSLPRQSAKEGEAPPQADGGTTSDKAPNDGEQSTKGLKAAGKKPKWAKMSAANRTRAKRLAGSITKVFAKQKPLIIKQVVATYGKASADKAFTVRTSRLQKSESTADQIAADVEINFDAIVQVSAVQLTKAAREGADDAHDFLDGRGNDFSPEKIAVGIGDYNAAELVTNISATTRDMIARDIDAAFVEGMTTTELADKLAENYAFSDTRAEVIARTEIAKADMDASMKAYRESGVVKGKKWLLAEEPCQICEDNANDGTIDLDDNFSSGDDAAPAHPNCECDVAPVVETENDTTTDEEE
jgi:hypothetical protein